MSDINGRGAGLSRRQALLTPAALATFAAAAPLSTLLPTTAEAKAPFRGNQVPYWYRFKIGKAECTVVSDGPLPLGEPANAFKGVAKEELTKSLADNFLPTDKVVLEQNALVVNTGSKVVLFDTGMGTSKMFGKTTGRLIKSLLEAGIDPSRIDAVVISHAHIDHIGGMVNAKGRRLFPNAQVYINQADFDFWTDEKKLTGDSKAFIEHARKNLLPYRDRIVFVKDSQEFLPGIQAFAAPGHTVGHMIYIIQSDGKSLCNIGDLTHHQVLLTEKPRTEFAYDTDPKQSAATRVRILDMLASQKIPMCAFHFPWPGIGNVAKQGDGFRYFATPMQMVL